MNVDFVYRIVLYVCKKNKQQGYISPDDFNLVINQASDSFQDYLVGEFQQYQNGRAIARVSWSQNQITRQRLSPTIYNFNLAIDGAGFSPYPGDYLQADAMWNIYGESRVTFVGQDRLYSYLNSVIDPIATNPIYLIEDEGFRFYPKDFGAAKMSYVRKAPQIVWGYTLDGNGRPVYDTALSADPIWSDLDCLEIVARALRIIGVNLDANGVSQYANEIKTTGQ